MFPKKRAERIRSSDDRHATYAPSSCDVDLLGVDGVPQWPLSDGEVNAFYWFMQGSIMIPETRHRLWAAWGFCERHAWGHLAVEAAFRPRHLMGPSILYLDLIERALRCFSSLGSTSQRHLRRCLAAKGPCMMCEMKVYGAGAGVAPAARIERGRSVENLRAVALETRVYWQQLVCGLCSGSGADVLCRPHLLERLRSRSAKDVEWQLRLLVGVRKHLEIYDRSFVWEYRNTDSLEDRAALFSAIGWMSGWRPVLAVF